MRSIDKDSVDNIQVILMKNDFLFYQIQELAGNVGITDEDEIKIMVNFYHDLGLLIHYGSSGTIDNVLRNTVVLQPHWLVDMFRSVVLAKPKTDKVSFKNWQFLHSVPIFWFHQPVNFLYVFSIYVKLQNFLYDNFGGFFQWSFSKDKWKTFEQKGILDDSLLEDIWKKVSMQKPVLLGLMEKFDLLCPAYTQVLKLSLSPLEYLLFQPVSIKHNIKQCL